MCVYQAQYTNTTNYSPNINSQINNIKRGFIICQIEKHTLLVPKLATHAKPENITLVNSYCNWLFYTGTSATENNPWTFHCFIPSAKH